MLVVSVMDDRNPGFAHGQDIRDRAFAFACRIVRFCQALYDAGGVARLMARQLLDAGTALFPQLEEARAGESRKDFISKCAIGLKEIRESHGRLRVHEACRIGPPAEATALRLEANELVSIMTAIGNARANTPKNAKSSPKSRLRSYEKVVSESRHSHS